MKNLKSIEALVDYIEKWDVSESMIEIHDQMIYSMDTDQFDENIQGSLYTLKETAKLIKAIEKELSGEEDIKILKAQISQLEKSNKDLRSHLEESRSFSESLLSKLKDNG